MGAWERYNGRDEVEGHRNVGNFHGHEMVHDRPKDTVIAIPTALPAVLLPKASLRDWRESGVAISSH
jgi:hypothetical protein